jgi:hypothetical protein
MYRRPELEFKWPNLSGTDYRVTSPKSQEYNCFAYAAGETDRWWQATPGDFFYWPDGVPQEETLEAYIQAYQTVGYEPCDRDDLEPGFEKIALYVDSENTPTHAARLSPNGNWTSKLGWLEDIEHELDALTGDRYGIVGKILKRPVDDTSNVAVSNET